MALPTTLCSPGACTAAGSDQPLKVHLDSKPFFDMDGAGGRVSQEFEDSLKQRAFPHAEPTLAWEPQAHWDDSSHLLLKNFLVMQQQSLLAAGMMPFGVSPDAWGADATGLWPILPGMIVQFHGLQSDADLNGQQGLVERFDILTGRWVVNMANGENNLAKPCNLQVVPSGLPMRNGRPFQEFHVQARPQRQCEDSFVSGAKAPSPQTCRLRKASADSLESQSTDSGDQRSNANQSSSPDSGLFEEAATIDTRTTLMMRNVPNDYSRAMLLDLLNKQGFATSYDFIYLPIDFRTEAGLGYAFINLSSPGEAERFRQIFHGFSDWDVITQKVCEVSWSDALQGLQCHIDRYKNSPVMHESVPDVFKPALYEQGKRMPFPEATKRIRAPRLRRPGTRNGPTV